MAQLLLKMSAAFLPCKSMCCKMNAKKADLISCGLILLISKTKCQVKINWSARNITECFGLSHMCN